MTIGEKKKVPMLKRLFKCKTLYLMLLPALIFEETGLRPVFAEGFRETDGYELKEKPGTRKQVVYFLAESGNEPMTAQMGEIRNVELLPYKQAMERFEWEGTRRVLAAAYRFLKGR